jgi:hypothetical protein
LNQVDRQIDYSWTILKERPLGISLTTSHALVEEFTLYEWRDRPALDWKMKHSGLKSDSIS